MSTPAEAVGRVYDLGFERYEGPRGGRRPAMLAVYEDGLRAAAGLGRGGRAKILPWIAVAASLVPAIVMALVAGAVNRLAPDFQASDLPSYADYYAVASIVLLVFAATVGPELFCPDRRDGTISLYLVRPLEPLDWAAARWAALFTTLVAAAWLPQTILLAGLAFGAPDPGHYLAHHWLDVPRFLVAGLALAAWTTTAAALVSAFTTRRTYAAAFLVGLFVVAASVIGGVGSAVSSGIGRWLGLLSLPNVPLLVNDLVFHAESASPGVVHLLPGAVQVGWYVVALAAALLAVAWRYRRLAA
jgi:ABC-2 type transport system permease protein